MSKKPVYSLDHVGQQLVCRIDLLSLVMHQFFTMHFDLVRAQRPSRYLVNCHDVDRLMSAQFGLLICVNKMVRVEGGRLELFKVNDQLMELCEEIGLNRQLLIHPEGEDDSTDLNGSPVPAGPRNGPRSLSEKRKLFSTEDDSPVPLMVSMEPNSDTHSPAPE